MKKLLGISASKRPWGNCEAAVKSILVSAAQEGGDTGFARLADFRIEACRGCFSCLGGDRTCPVDDDLYSLLETIEAAEALVLAGPVYFMTAPATIVALLDRLLTMGRVERAGQGERPAVTLTIMGNHEWRGVAQPVINMTVSLLGFEIAESMRLVAQGPGEIIADPKVTERFEEVGRLLARGESVASSDTPMVCPVCASDFFRIEPPEIVCPICGCAGDLDVYTDEGRFEQRGGRPRWGLSWLDKHIESWIKPSVRQYKLTRKQTLRRLGNLKDLYSRVKGKG